VIQRKVLPAVAAVVFEMLAVTSYGGVPPSEEQPVEETLFGVKVVDPYRWLEGSAAPEIAGDDPELDQRVADWTDDQNAYARSVLDNLPGREALERRLRELLEVGSIQAPQMRRDRYFYLQREGDQPQFTAWVRRGPQGEPRLLIDPNALDPEGLTSLSWIEPDQAGERLAFGLFTAGDERTVLRVLDVGSGEWLADEIPGKVNSVYWLPGGTELVYHRLADVDDPYSGQIRLHRLGRHHRHDPVIFEQYDHGPLATTWGPFAILSRDGRWLLLGYWTGTDSNDLAVVDFERWRRTGELAPRTIVSGEPARAGGVVVGDTLLLHTTLGAANGRVMAVDLRDPRRESWREVIPERPRAVIEDVAVADGRLAVTFLEDASSRIEQFTLDGRPLGAVALPGLGTASISTEPDRTETFVSFESFNESPTVYRVDLESGERTVWARPEVPADLSEIEVRQVRYRSKDGTTVPMFLVHRRGLELDGDNPALLYGYGGFGISMTPAFTASLVPWLEAGGVYAVANLRGGGELGEVWHRAGMLAAKQQVFDDFIAAAGWLIEEGYTRPHRLAIAGGSNGGLLTGAALVQRPELFAAVISRVPLLDMLRYQHFLMAKYWVPEYGSAEDREQFGYLLAYSPYHNVVPGTRYPAVLLTAGENDARVHPLHARKMAARLQAATASDPESDPVLLYVERQAGHGAGKPLDERIRETADQGIFLLWQLGMLDEGDLPDALPTLPGNAQAAAESVPAGG
jgi:prolyl oligopeptidase